MVGEKIAGKDEQDAKKIAGQGVGDNGLHIPHLEEFGLFSGKGGKSRKGTEKTGECKEAVFSRDSIMFEQGAAQSYEKTAEHVDGNGANGKIADGKTVDKDINAVAAGGSKPTAKHDSKYFFHG